MSTKKCIFIFFLLLVVTFITYLFCNGDLNFRYLLPNHGHRRILKKKAIKLFLWPDEHSSRFEWFNWTEIPLLEGSTYNEAVRGKGQCIRPLALYDERSSACISGLKCHIVLVTHIIEINDSKHSTYFLEHRPPIQKEIQAYFMNMYYIIQHNLNNPKLKAVVILCESESMAEKLHRIDFENSRKLSIQNINSVITMGKQMEYSSRCFRNEIVIVANQDIVLGDGWDRLNVNYMKTNKVMYALTRYPSLRDCFATLKKSSCIHNRRMGSYDAFVWHVKEYLKEDIFIEKLGVSKVSTKGMENVVVWIFKKVLNYEVANPCRILKIHHEHCIPIRDSERGNRINTNGSSALADFIVKLKQT